MQVVCRHPRRLFQWKGLRLMWCDMCVRFGTTCGAVFVLVCLLWFHQHNTKMKPKLQNLWIKLRIFRHWYFLIVGFYWYSIRNMYVMITLDAENSLLLTQLVRLWILYLCYTLCVLDYLMVYLGPSDDVTVWIYPPVTAATIQLTERENFQENSEQNGVI